jgi:hypothetical protein
MIHVTGVVERLILLILVSEMPTVVGIALMFEHPKAVHVKDNV